MCLHGGAWSAPRSLNRISTAAFVAVFSLALPAPAAAQGMTPAPAQQRSADPSPAVPQPGAERMRSPADQEPYGYPASTATPRGESGNTAPMMDSERSNPGNLRVGTGSGNVLRDNSENAGATGGAVGRSYEGALRSGTDVDFGQSGRSDGDTSDDRNARGFPIGVLGLLGLGGVLNLFRRRKTDPDLAGEAPSRRRVTS